MKTIGTARSALRPDDGAGSNTLVNNAGLFLGKGIEEASLDEWHRLCAVYLTGIFLGTKLVARRSKASPHGSAIVNLASVAGLVGSQLDPPLARSLSVCASKVPPHHRSRAL